MEPADRRERPVGRATIPWYSEGLRFSCKPDCGACCVSHGDYDYVYLEPEDIGRLSEHLGVDRKEFRRTYTERERDYVVLKMSGPDCPFLREKRCTVYEARPIQCWTFPFWRENLRSRSSWERLREFCPGIGEGEEHSSAAILRYCGPPLKRSAAR